MGAGWLKREGSFNGQNQHPLDPWVDNQVQLPLIKQRKVDVANDKYTLQPCEESLAFATNIQVIFSLQNGDEEHVDRGRNKRRRRHTAGRTGDAANGPGLVAFLIAKRVMVDYGQRTRPATAWRPKERPRPLRMTTAVEVERRGHRECIGDTRPMGFRTVNRWQYIESIQQCLDHGTW